MGGRCSKTKRLSVDGIIKSHAPSGSYSHNPNGHVGNGSEQLPAKVSNSTPSPVGESINMPLRDPFTFEEVNTIPNGISSDDMNDGIPRLPRALSKKSRSMKSKQAAVAKVCLNLICSSFMCS